MHDIGAVQHIIEQLKGMKKKPGKLRIELGLMKGEPERVSQLFNEMVRGTELESVELDIVPVPVEIRCECGFSGKIEIKEHVHFARCPECGRIAEILNGDSINIKVMR